MNKLNFKMQVKFILVLLSVINYLSVSAQTGPGGVGSAAGSTGQPRNVLWLDASTLTYADGADIPLWDDISGNGNDLAQPDNTIRPIFTANVINSLPIARFAHGTNDGTRLVLDPYNDMPTSGITNFVIYKTTDASEGLISYNTSSRDNAFLLFNSDNLRTYVNGSVYTPGGEPDYNSGSPVIMAHRWKSSGGVVDYYRDGDQMVTGTVASGGSIPTGGRLALGGEQDNPDTFDDGQAFDGDIAEVIIYNSYLNSAQILLVENYLSQKYNINFATASNDHFGTDASYNSAYVKNIAGIGQEADGDHTQTVSGGLYIYEWNSSLADGEYVMLAHNGTVNSSTTATNADLVAPTEKRWARDYYIEKTGSVDAKLIFDFKEALSDGQYPANVANYVLLYRNATTGNYSKVTVANQGINDADQVYFDVADADLQNGYYTIGTDDQTNSPVEGVSGRTWYALASGSWDDSNFWTLDPSGSLPNNPDNDIPSAIDKVVIHTGKTITIPTNNKTVAEITVDGILDIGTTSGHNFTKINGSGRIRLSSDNFPLGDATHFITAGQGEGTVVWQGGSYNLSTPHTFFKMEVALDNPSNTITQLADYTLNGDLVVETGILQINDNSATTDLNLTVNGNVSVEANGQILTGSGDARHQFNMYGDFTNNGTVKFTNRTAADYLNEATDGIVDANFLNGSKDQTILCNGLTNFYRIEIDKGTDMTYELSISASSTANFNLYGYANQGHSSVSQLAANDNALGLLKGTVRIRSNVVIPSLNSSGNYNISEAARLWVDGGSVTKLAGTGYAIVPYGEAKITAGTFESYVGSGFTIRDNGAIIVEGGVLNTSQIRTSVLGASHVGSYIQTGGTANILGSNSATDYYVFNLTYPANVFQMSGGTLHIHEAHGRGGIFINSDPSNVSVTGGTVICEISDNEDFIITSRAPFWDVILRNTSATGYDHILAEGVDVGSTDEYLAAQPLVVLNDLTIEDDCFLDHNGQDITVGRNFSIAENSQQQGYNNYGLLYDSAKPNTLTFNGTEDGEFYIGHNVDDTYELYLSNFTINKPADKSLTLKGDPNKEVAYVRANSGDNLHWHARLINTQGNFLIESGIFNQGEHSIRMFGAITVKANGQCGVYVPGVTNTGAFVMFKDNDTNINTEKGAIFGNVKMNPEPITDIISFTSDVYIKRIGYYYGRINLKNHNLKVDYLHEQLTTNNYNIASGNSSNEMIYTDGNASDGGLSILVTQNATHGFPLGMFGKYTPAEVIVTDFSDDGYIQINPVDQILQTTNLSGGDILSYYWRVRYEGFTTNPTVQLQFTYDTSDDDNSAEATFYPGKVLDINPFTRSYENDLTKVDETNNTITFNDSGSGFTLEQANYTAGVANRFTGSVQVFYVRDNGDWNDNNTWSFTRGGASAGDYPKAGDVAVMRRLATSYSGIVTIRQAETCAQVVYDDENGFSSGCPRIIFDTQNNYASYNSNLGTVDVASSHEGGTLNYSTHGAVVQYNIEDNYTQINALEFDGVDDYIAIQNMNYSGSAYTQMTVEAWIKTTDGSNQIIASFDRSEYWRLEINGDGAGYGQVGFDIMTDAGQLDFGSVSRVDDGKWHHIAAVYNAGTATIYIDGVADATANLGTTFGTGVTRYGFISIGSEASSFDGSTAPNNYFNGSISDFRLWNDARTAAEISANKDAALTGGEANFDIYYKFDDGAGSSTANDYTGNTNHGTLRNFNVSSFWVTGPAWTSGIHAVDFGSGNAYGAIQNYNYAAAGNTAMTVEAWIKTTDGSDQVIASYDRNEYWRLEINGNGAGTGQIGFDIMTDAGQLDFGGTTRVDDGNWHHIAAVYDNGTATIYIDGTADATATLGTTFGSGTTRYGFLGVGSEASTYNGTVGPSNYFNGEMAEFRLWSDARTASEISGNKDSELAGTEANLEIYTKMDDAVGMLANDYANSNDVDLFGFPASGTWVQGPWGGMFPDGDFGGFNNYPNALVIYRWDGATSGADVMLSDKATEYPQMWFEAGNRNRKFRFPNEDITVHGLFYVPGQCIVVANGTSDNTITFEQDVRIGHTSCCGPDGQFLFPGNDSHKVTVIAKKNIRVASSSSLLGIENPTGKPITHKLIAYGDILMDATGGDIFFGDGDKLHPNVELELQNESDNTFTDNSGEMADFYRIIMNKGTSQTNSFSFNSNFNLSGATSGVGVKKSIELQNGTLIINHSDINQDINTGDDDFEIPENACLEVRLGQVNVSGDNTGIALDGKLLISGGTLNMDDAAHNGNNYIEYSGSARPELVITGGTLTVGSQIRRGLGTSTGSLKYNQSGGTVVIAKNAAPEGNRGILEILNLGSGFTHSGGTLELVRQQTSPTVASLYLDPETSNLTDGTTITLGNASTPVSQEFGIYSTVNLQNLTLDNTSANNPKAKMWTIPLTLDGTLLISSGTEFNANGLDLNCYGDFTNSGTFTANGNTTYFKDNTDQTITGNTTFYNLTNQNTANLNLAAGSSDIIVDNILDMQSGALVDNANEIWVYGNINNDATHIYGGTGLEDGISMLGTTQQTMTGSGTYGKLTINNGNDVVLTVGSTPFIEDYLKLESGVLNIGGNILTLGIDCQIQEANPFGINNMIGTNVSFTDYGVKKYFPSGAGSFTYPVGSVSGAENKYTPVVVTVTQNSSNTGYLIVKPADEIHPTIVEDSEAPDPEITDADNMLQYYWVLTAQNFTDGIGTVEMYYNEGDVKVTSPYDVYDYITAELLNDGSGNWLKYDDVSKFDETNKKLIFDFNNASDVDITGDYTAGVDGSSFLGAIPDQVPLYVSKGITGTNGNYDWHTADTWRVDDGSGSWVLPASIGLPDIPDGARVRIVAGDRVTTSLNYINAYTSDILGTLDVGTTYANRVGNVTGTGTLYTERGTLPGGYYEAFLAETGGTLEFGGSTDYSVLSNIPQVNNIIFSGTLKRELPNIDLVVLGNFTIDGADASLNVVNEFDKKLDIHKNIVFNSGTFDAGTGATAVVELNGTAAAQTISGTGSFAGGNAFNHLIINNTNGINLQIPADVEQTLTFSAGIIQTDVSNILKLTNTLENIVIGAGTSKYVDGPLMKNIISGQNFEFPVGDNNRYGNISVLGSSVSNYWTAEYYNHNPNDDGYDPTSINSGTGTEDLTVVSDNEYWRVKCDVSATSELKLRYDLASGMPVDNDMRIAKWFDLATDAWDDVASNAPSGGYISSNSASISFNEFTDGGYFTLSTVYIPQTLTWEGDESTVWNTSGNWNLNVVPTALDDIIIPSSGVTYEPSISIAAHCKAIDLQASRTLTINAGHSLTAHGDFTFNGTMILKSPVGEGASASFIDNGVITGSGVMQAERYLSANKFHYVSTPIQAGGNAGSDLFTTHSSGNFNPNFFKYDETYDLDGNPATAPAGAFDSQNLVPGWTYAHDNGSTNVAMDIKTGYAAWSDENRTITYIGTPTTGDVVISGLTYTDNDAVSGPLPNYYDGWNLVANPYPSAIDWDLAKVGRTNIDDGIYVWDGSQYASYAGGVQGGSTNLTNEIAPMQAFFVHTTANTGSFTLQNSHRVHSSQIYLKAPVNDKNQAIPNFVRLKMQANGYSDYAVVYFKSNATKGFDGSFDAFKLYSSLTAVPHIFTRTSDDDTPLSINVLPNTSLGQITVPLYIKIGDAGTYTISVDEFNFENNHVYFIDKYDDVQIYLNDEAVQDYTFSCKSGELADRFELRFFENNPPIKENYIPDMEILASDVYIYTVPENIFNEIDIDDSLRYSAELADGNPLPEWLSFDAETRTFSGVAPNMDILDIIVTATDNFGASASDEYRLTVNQVVNSDNNLDAKIGIYPNPTSDFVFVNLVNSDTESNIRITDLAGRLIFETNITTDRTKIDLSDFAAGAYFIEIRNSEQSYTEKLVVKK